MPRGFNDINDLENFKRRLADALPLNVDAVMQGSSVEGGGNSFRFGGGDKASDFDVSLTGVNLYENARSLYPGSANETRVGPFTADEMRVMGIDVSGTKYHFGRDTNCMIYSSNIEFYKRGTGYPLMIRK